MTKKLSPFLTNTIGFLAANSSDALDRRIDGAEQEGRRHVAELETRDGSERARLDPFDEDVQSLLALHPCQLIADAEMRAETEGEVCGRILAVEAQTVRIG